MGSRVQVVGGGVIGLACAWELSRNGHEVTVVAPAPGRDGASWVAAGMLAPVTEAQFGESALTALLVEGARRWPAFAAALEGATGHAIGYDTTGTVTVALDASDRASLDDLLAYQHSLGLEAHRRSASECRAPGARPQPRPARRHRGPGRPPGRQPCPPRRAACGPAARGGVTFVEGTVAALEDGPALVLADGRRLGPDHVVLAAGTGLPCHRRARRGRAPPAPPRQGAHPAPRAARRAPRPLPLLTPHGARPGARALGVPGAAPRRLGRRRGHRRGARQRHRGAGGRGARAALRRPGDRPRRRRARAARGGHRAAARHARTTRRASAGPASTASLAAVGHYRNGILLAPLTAAAVVDLVGRRPVAPLIEALAPA